MPELRQRLGGLGVAHFEQKREAVAWDESVERLLMRYEANVQTLSTQLLRCEAVVRKLELAKKHAAQNAASDQ